MNIPKITQYNNIICYNKGNNNIYNKNITFGSELVEQESNFFKPIKKLFAPIRKAYDSTVENIAKSIGKIFNTETAFNILEKTKRNKLLMNHLMTFGSIILSGFYVLRTLSNKDLEEKKKNTLAINQTAVFALSTIMCYTLDGLLNKHVAKFTNRFEVVNHNLPKEKLAKCLKGMPAAKSVGIFDIIYRFIAPVMITPIANHIGNKLNDKQEAELTKTKQA